MNKLASIIKFLKERGHVKEAAIINDIIKKEAGKKDYKIIEPILKDFKMFGFEDPYTGDQFYSEGGYSKIDLDALKNLELGIDNDRLNRVTGRYERSFLMLGAILTGKVNIFGLVFDYIDASNFEGGIFSKYNLNKKDIADKEKVISTFNLLDQEQKAWHDNMGDKSKEILESMKDGDSGNGFGKYKTNDVTFKFKNGYRIVKIPGAEDTEFKWPGAEEPTSYDRVMEGNIMGMCLGSEGMLYQSNSCEVYSLRSAANIPHVTMRVEGDKITEIKGTGNEVPVSKYSGMIRAWIKSRPDLSVNGLSDYYSLPINNVEELEDVIGDGEYNYVLFENDLISKWYDHSSKAKEYVNKMKDLGYYILLNTKIASEDKDGFRDLAKSAAGKIMSSVSGPDGLHLDEGFGSPHILFENSSKYGAPWKRYEDEEWCMDVVDKYVRDLDKFPHSYANETSPFFSEGFYKNDKFSSLASGRLVDLFLHNSLYRHKSHPNSDDAIEFLLQNNFSMLTDKLEKMCDISFFSHITENIETIKFMQPALLSLIEYGIDSDYFYGCETIESARIVIDSFNKGTRLTSIEIKIFKMGIDLLLENTITNRYGFSGIEGAIKKRALELIAMKKIMWNDDMFLLKFPIFLDKDIERYDEFDLIYLILDNDFFNLISESGHAKSSFKRIKDKVYSSEFRMPNGDFNLFGILDVEEGILENENIKKVFPEMVDSINNRI